jgi:hypothetical protein
MDSSAKYKVKEIESTSDRAYPGAISIYAAHTLPALRTDTNEIGHWLNHYNKTFEDRLHILALYLNTDLAGFCQFVYLKDVNLIVIDYITIDEKYRGGLNVFFEFAEHIKAFVKHNYPDFVYVAVEVAPLRDDPDARYGLKLMRLLKMLGFGVVDAIYIQPQLGKSNLESELSGAVMLFPKPINGTIRRDSYLNLVHTIYYSHYVRWYGVHGSKYQEEYKTSVDRLYKKIENQNKKPSVVVNGLKEFPGSMAPVVVKESKIPVKEILLPFAIILFGLAFILLLSLISKITLPMIASTLLILVVVYLAFASVINPRAIMPLKEMLKALRAVFGKAK